MLFLKRVESEKNVYIVKAGDNLYSIANKYNITVNELKKANNLENSYWGVTFIFITVYNKFVYKMRPNRP